MLSGRVPIHVSVKSGGASWKAKKWWLRHNSGSSSSVSIETASVIELWHTKTPNLRKFEKCSLAPHHIKLCVQRPHNWNVVQKRRSDNSISIKLSGTHSEQSNTPNSNTNLFQAEPLKCCRGLNCVVVNNHTDVPQHAARGSGHFVLSIPVSRCPTNLTV